MINILLKTPTFITLFRIGTPHASGLAVVFLMLIGQQPGVAQPNQPSKTYASSYSRGLLSIEKLEEQADSTVERMANPGYVLTDVGLVGDLVEQSLLRSRVCAGEDGAAARTRFLIEPGEAIDDQHAVPVLVGIGRTDPFVDEGGDAEF